jgi:glyoxylase-like metal-dependent hydrolase (beta-lactamase superfamily II)
VKPKPGFSKLNRLKLGRGVDEMASVKEVAERTYRIQVQIPNVYPTFTVYFIDEEKGVVIDPGPASAIPSIKEGMAELGMKELSYIIPTHVHVDHGGATGSLAQLFPRSKVIIHPLGEQHLINPCRLIESTKMSYGDDFENRLGPIIQVPQFQVHVPKDGETISIGSRELQIIYAPGHAPHHSAIFDLKTKGLFCGEALGLPTKSARSWPLPNAAPPSFDMGAYLETIGRLGQLRPRFLFYAHDGVGRNPEELIYRVNETTNAMGDTILKALRAGETAENIDRRIQEYVSKHFGVNIEGVDTRVSVEGFIHYFKKKGLVF